MLLKFALQDFYDDREYKNLSSTTIDSYKEILRQFEVFCTSQKVVDVHDVSRKIVRDYLIWCSKRGNNATTTNTKLRRIRAFLNYLVEIEVIESNAGKKVSPSIEDIRIEVFTDHHIKQMLNYYRRFKHRDKAFFAYRGHTLIITFLGSGIRLTELTLLKWTDIDFKQGSMGINGKNRMYETIPIADKLVKELASYKVYCEQRFEGQTRSEHIFTDRQNEPLTPNAIQNIFKRLSKTMNFKDVRLSSHTFRHTFCQKCIQSGMSTFAVQRLMRHRSITTTQKYAAMWGEELREQLVKYNPLNDIDF